MMKFMAGPRHSDPGSAHFRLWSAWSKASCSPKISTRWPSPPPQFQGSKQARGDSLATGKGSIHPAVASVACTQTAFPDPAERPLRERLSQHPKSHCCLLSFQRKRGAGPGRARTACPGSQQQQSSGRLSRRPRTLQGQRAEVWRGQNGLLYAEYKASMWVPR